MLTCKLDVDETLGASVKPLFGSANTSSGCADVLEIVAVLDSEEKWYGDEEGVVDDEEEAVGDEEGVGDSAERPYLWTCNSDVDKGLGDSDEDPYLWTCKSDVDKRLGDSAEAL